MADFAREAAAAGAFGLNIDDQASLMSAVREGLRNNAPACGAGVHIANRRTAWSWVFS
jgi:hypothetical protein